MLLFDQLTQKLSERQPLPALCPGHIHEPQLSEMISGANEEELFGSASATTNGREMRAACRSGLLLLNDDLDASHTIAQGIDSPTGSFWHAIMHRREGDFSNSIYWWRKTGRHEAFGMLFDVACAQLDGETEEGAGDFKARLEKEGQWLPEDFVDYCERAVRRNENRDWLLRLQKLEITTLLNWCRERAA